MTAKFDRMGNFGRWGTNRYITHDDFKENNVLDQFLKGWSDVKTAKETVWQQYSGFKQYRFDETWNAREFLSSLNELRRKNVLWLRLDARNLGSAIGRKVVDVVFTDPPYRGEVECIQYFELSTFYTGWLSLDEDLRKRYGDFVWWQNEITENERQGKDMSVYYRLLANSFSATDSITKQGAVWLITYHSPSEEVWEGVRHVLFESTGLKPPTYEQVVTHRIRAKGVGSFNVTRFGSVGEDAYIVLKKKIGPLKEPAIRRALNEAEFLMLILKKMRRQIIQNSGIVDWGLFQEHYPAVVLRHGDLFSDTKSYKDFFESITIPLAGDARIFDRDKIGDELYRAIYGGITATRYLRRALEICGQARKEISRSEMEYKILPKIDGRISNKSRTRMLKQLFDYDPIGNKYLYRGPKTRTLEKWMPKPRRKVVLAPPMPQELALKIVEAGRKYGGHVVKEVREDFHLIVEAAGRKYRVNINDEGGVRRFGAGASNQEKKDQVIVFVYHGLRPDQLTNLAVLVKPSSLVAVPYTEYQKAIDAFRKYDPMEDLEHMIVKA